VETWLIWRAATGDNFDHPSGETILSFGRTYLPGALGTDAYESRLVERAAMPGGGYSSPQDNAIVSTSSPRRLSSVKIRIVVPITKKGFAAATRKHYISNARPDTEISVVSVDRGPLFIESIYDEALAVPDTVAKIVQAEIEGMDAAIPNCACDTAVEEARQMVSIPVIGPGEASMHLAAMLGHRFSVVDTVESYVTWVERRALQAGLASKLTSVRAVNIPVLEMDDREGLLLAIVDQSASAIREDRAHAIVLGCTGMAGLAKEVEEGLRKQGLPRVPVIDPTIAALKMAESLVDMRVSHSKLTYPAPPTGQVFSQ